MAGAHILLVEDDAELVSVLVEVLSDAGYRVSAATRRGEAALPLPPAIIVQGTGDDNVTPDMADRFTAAYRARGGQIELHKFDGQPHTFIVRDPTSEASRRATELVRDFVLAQTSSS